jgi:hypothetical protein
MYCRSRGMCNFHHISTYNVPLKVIVCYVVSVTLRHKFHDNLPRLHESRSERGASVRSWEPSISTLNRLQVNKRRWTGYCTIKIYPWCAPGNPQLASWTFFGLADPDIYVLAASSYLPSSFLLLDFWYVLATLRGGAVLAPGSICSQVLKYVLIKV